MRLLFLGDVVGRTGRTAVIETLPDLRRRFAFDFVVVNGENAAGGFGITEAILDDLLAAGVDAVTLGNHAFAQKETFGFIGGREELLRPLNYPPGTPGRGARLFQIAGGRRVLVINVMGRVFMTELDCPFRAVDAVLAAHPLKSVADAVLVDIHAEATSEKQALGCFVDGRASVAVGSHTHTPTADERILPGGTAYMTDAGMCGDYNSVLGMKMEESLNRYLTRIPRGHFEPAGGPATICGFAVETDDATGLAVRCAPLRVGGVLTPALPSFWSGKP